MIIISTYYHLITPGVLLDLKDTNALQFIAWGVNYPKCLRHEVIYQIVGMLYLLFLFLVFTFLIYYIFLYRFLFFFFFFFFFYNTSQYFRPSLRFSVFSPLYPILSLLYNISTLILSFIFLLNPLAQFTLFFFFFLFCSADIYHW